MQHFYPINLNLQDKSVLVIGLGKVADQKILQLKNAGAKVNQIPTEQYSSKALAGNWLVVSATDDPELNAQIYKDANKVQVWLNSCDDPDNCTAILPANFRRGSLMVTVSSGGESPAFSSWVRNQLEDFLPLEYENLLQVITEVRGEIRIKNVSSELFNWQSSLDLAIEKGILDLVREENLNEAKELLKECLSLS